MGIFLEVASKPNRRHFERMALIISLAGYLNIANG